MRPQNLIIYSLPVSGGAFVSQLGLLSELYEALIATKVHSHKPDLAMASSGGNVAVYAAMAGGWSPEGIKRVTLGMNKDMFTRSWFPTGLQKIPSFMAGIFCGAIYNEGYGGKYLYEKYFTSTSISDVEIWTGTFNRDTIKAELFCNKTQTDALIQNALFFEDKNFFDTMNLNYLGGSEDVVERLADVTVASASIPYLVKNKVIEHDTYLDGGVMYASPTTPLRGELYNLVTGSSSSVVVDHEEFDVSATGDVTEAVPFRSGRRRLCHYYICSYDTDASYVKSTIQGVNIPLADTLSQVIHSSILVDRSVVPDMIKALAGPRFSEIQHINYPLVTTAELGQILVWLDEHAEHYSCVLYPYGEVSISIASFTASDIHKAIDVTRTRYGVRLCILPYTSL